jgi:putative NADH-flavin reductase
MKPLIAVIGGTGKSGKYLVKQLLHEGYNIKLLTRQPENIQIQSPLVQIVKGDARNPEAISTLLLGCGAVVSTLGQPKGETPIFSAATTNVVNAMQVHCINRYIVTTGVNVDTPFDNKGTAAKFATEWMKTNYTATTADKQTEYKILSASAVDWTLVRLPLIEQTDAVSEIGVSLEDCPSQIISAANLANFLIGQLADKSYYKEAPFIANK